MVPPLNSYHPCYFLGRDKKMAAFVIRKSVTTSTLQSSHREVRNPILCRVSHIKISGIYLGSYISYLNKQSHALLMTSGWLYLSWLLFKRWGTHKTGPVTPFDNTWDTRIQSSKTKKLLSQAPTGWTIR